MFPNVLEVVRQYIRERVEEGETVVDATMGNGNDTLFLAQLVGERGKVYAYDVQSEAIEKTRARLEREQAVERVNLLLTSHEQIKEIPVAIGAVMFNLGYLPGGNKDITTQANTTIRAIEAGLDKLRTGGIMTIIIYWGHEAGAIEKEAVVEYCEKLPQTEYLVLRYQYMNQQNQAPFIIAIEKR